MDNNEVLYDAEMAKQLIKKHFSFTSEFSKYCSLYAFTNENLKNFMDKLNIKDANILTVAGSGDHLFECILRGAKQITIFDINKLTKYYIDLKIAAIQTLDRNEFIKYLFLNNNYEEVFSTKTYKKIREQLTKESKLFWDQLYINYCGQTIRRSYLFFSTEECYEFLNKTNLYLEPNHYKTLQEMLNRKRYKLITNETFQNINFTELVDNNKNTKYDYIFLSNIADYLSEIYGKQELIKFKNFICNDLNSILTDEGIICAAYLFWPYIKNKKIYPKIENKNLRKQYFLDNFEEWIIDNSHLPEMSDDVALVYRKKHE